MWIICKNSKVTGDSSQPCIIQRRRKISKDLNPSKSHLSCYNIISEIYLLIKRKNRGFLTYDGVKSQKSMRSLIQFYKKFICGSGYVSMTEYLPTLCNDIGLSQDITHTKNVFPVTNQPNILTVYTIDYGLFPFIMVRLTRSYGSLVLSNIKRENQASCHYPRRKFKNKIQIIASTEHTFILHHFKVENM